MKRARVTKLDKYRTWAERSRERSSKYPTMVHFDPENLFVLFCSCVAPTLL